MLLFLMNLPNPPAASLAASTAVPAQTHLTIGLLIRVGCLLFSLMLY